MVCTKVSAAGDICWLGSSDSLLKAPECSDSLSSFMKYYCHKHIYNTWVVKAQFKRTTGSIIVNRHIYSMLFRRRVHELVLWGSCNLRLYCLPPLLKHCRNSWRSCYNNTLVEVWVTKNYVVATQALNLLGHVSDKVTFAQNGSNHFVLLFPWFSTVSDG